VPIGGVQAGSTRHFAPWIPIALPVKVRVRFGAPLAIDPDAASNKERAEQETLRLQAAVQQLVDELAAGAPADPTRAPALPSSPPT
jgi:hypothetical protein